MTGWAKRLLHARERPIATRAARCLTLVDLLHGSCCNHGTATRQTAALGFKGFSNMIRIFYLHV